MSAGREGNSDDGGGGRFHTVQPHRDPQSNWTVDVAKNLEEYLLKICSGEISSEDGSNLSVNFAEAALLLQGSVQVYSRKVEYLYSLVLHALEFISQKRQQDQGESASPKCKGSPYAGINEESDIFWGLDDVPVEAKNCLDASSKDAPSSHFLKPPANLVVLEGDCLENTGDGGELESYVLANSYVYQDFILLDPCDAASVDDFLTEDKCDRGHSGAQRSKTLSTKSRKSFLSPTRRSGGTARKSSLRKGQDVNLNQTPLIGHAFEANEHDAGPDPHSHEFSENNVGFIFDDGYSEPMDYSDDSEEDDDPWKPLNPHEPGNLKVKPFKKVKASKGRGINSTKETPLSNEFPLAKLDGPISSEFTKIWKTQCCASERQQDSRSPPLFEKLRQSLVDGGHETCGAFGNFEVDNEDNGFDGGSSEFEQPDVDFPDPVHTAEDVPFSTNKHDGNTAHFDSSYSEHEDLNAGKSLEDLCRSHLDALLASIGESERQTELAARVSTWKQKIEHNLEEQDSHPPFDIHDYGGKILDKLAVSSDGISAMPFSDVVRGQEKHDVARSFSALLQLVNNGSVGLDKGGADGESVCYTAINPFHVNLLQHDKQRGVQLHSSKKRAKSPTRKGGTRGKSKSSSEISPTFSSSSSGFMSMKLRKVGRCTPESKRRRRSRFVESVDLHSAG